MDRIRIALLMASAPERARVRQALTDQLPGVPLSEPDGLDAALAALAGGGFELLLIAADSLGDGSARLAAARSARPDTAVILLVDSEDQRALAVLAAQAADDYVVVRGPGLQRLGPAVAHATRHLSLARELRRFDARLAALNAAALAVHGETDPDQIIAVVARELSQLGLRVSVFAIDAGGRARLALIGVAAPVLEELARLTGIHWTQFEFALDDAPLLARVCTTGRPLLLPEAAQLVAALLPAPLRALTGAVVRLAGAQATALLPLVVNGRAELVMAVDGPLVAGDLAPLTAFAHQTAAALEHAYLLRAARQRAEELERLYAASAALSSDLALDAVLERVSTQLVSALGVQSCTVLRWDRDHDRVVTLRDLDSDPSLQSEPGRSFAIPPGMRRALEERQPWLTLRSAPNLADADRGDLDRWRWRSVLYLPFIARDRVVGIVELGTRTSERIFTPDELRMAQNLANAAAIAIEHAQLFADAQQSLRQLESLREIGLQLARSLDRTVVLETIVAAIERSLHADVVQIVLADAQADRFRPVGGWTRRPPAGQAEFQPGDDSLIARVVRERRRVLLDDVASASARPVPEAEAWGVRTLAGLPLQVADRVVGALSVGYYAPHGFSREEVQFLELLADQAAVAIENAQLFNQQRQRAAQQATLYQISQHIALAGDLNDTLQAVLDGVRAGLGHHYIGILLLDAPRGEVVVAALTESLRAFIPHGHRQPVTRGVIGRAVATGESQLANDTRSDPDFFALETWHPLAELVIPLKLAGRVTGVLIIDSERSGVFTLDDVILLETLAGQVASAVERARLFAETERRLREQTVLYEAAAAIAGMLDADAILQRIAAQLCRLVDATSLCYYGWDEPRGECYVLSEYWTPAASARERASALGRSFPLAAFPAVARVLRAGEPQLLHASELERPADESGAPGAPGERRDAGGRSVLCVPLATRGRTIGYFEIWNTREERRYADDELRLLQALASQVAVGLENARLFQAVRSHAEELEARVAARTAEIRAAKERTEAILRSVADAVVVLDLQGNVVLTNPMADLLLTGEWGHDPALQQAVARLVRALATQGTPAAIETLLLPGLALEAHAARVSEDGLDIGTVVVLHDITRLRELDRMKSQFVSTVSHELRTPLANIKLYLTLLQKGRVEKRGEYFAVMEREVSRLEHLIDELLDLSRLEAAEGPAHREPIVLDELAESVLVNHLPLAAAKRLSLEHQAGTGVPAVIGDRNQLIQVLTNLIANAILYTPEEGRITVVSDAVVEEGQSYARLSVHDTGIGIPASELDRVFERFYRSPQVEASGVPGSGLGLAIVREIVGLHHGRVGVASAAGQGTTFTVWLPASPVSGGLP